LILSLCFELCAVLLLVVLVRRPPTRLLAKLLLGLLLLLDLAGTQVFVVLRTYAKGFQLTGLSVPELVAMAKAQVGLWQWLGIGVCATLAWTFGRPESIERAPVSRRTATLFLVLGVAAAAGVSRLILHPSSVPVVAHSPLTLLLVRPRTPTSLTRSRVTADDWAPARELAPQWRSLESVDRHFNLVVVVLESVRAEDFWPAATAPPLPQLQRRAEHSVAFTRAYAHEPLTVKGLEALLFGVYPTPFWEGLSEKRAQVALRSVPENVAFARAAHRVFRPWRNPLPRREGVSRATRFRNGDRRG